MSNKPNEYVVALRYGWLTSLYDPIVRWTTRESTFKRHLLEQTNIKTGGRVLDLGCGTGTLTILIKKSYPDTEVFGLDGDPKILRIARSKADRMGVQISLDQGMAFQLPYGDHRFDRVVSSLLFHHLTGENKRQVLREVFRVLTPGGEMHVADWGKSQNVLMRAAFFLVQLLDGFETTWDNVNGLMPQFFAEAGFVDIQETARYATVFGTLCL